jgi:hypothetical protein
MSIYTFLAQNQFLLIPSIAFGWEDDGEFYIDLIWMNVGLGVSFG